MKFRLYILAWLAKLFSLFKVIGCLIKKRKEKEIEAFANEIRQKKVKTELRENNTEFEMSVCRQGEWNFHEQFVNSKKSYNNNNRLDECLKVIIIIYVPAITCIKGSQNKRKKYEYYHL